VAEIDLPGKRDDLKVLVGSDGKLIKTREEIDLADAPTAVREAAAKLVPAGGELDDGVFREVTDGKATYSVEIDRPKIPDLDVLIAEDGTLINQTDDTGGLTCQWFARTASSHFAFPCACSSLRTRTASARRWPRR
jgi:hypothetical protein